MREKIKYIACAFLTVMLINMDMQPVTDTLMKNWSYYIIPIIFGSSGYNFLSLLELVLFYFFYRYSFPCYHRQKQTLRSKLCCAVPAVLFGFFMVLGNSFDYTDSWSLIIGCDNPVQLFKSWFAWFCYSVLFVHLIALLFDFIDRYRAGEIALGKKKKEAENAVAMPAADTDAAPAETEPAVQTDEAGKMAARKEKKKPKDYDITVPFRRFGHWYMRAFRAHTFLTALLTLLVVFVPAAIIFYPAIVQPDQLDEICQVLGVKYYTADYLELVDENVLWTNHHPVFFTLYFWLGLHAGHLLFHSYNAGLFLCVLGQIVVFAAAVASAICVLREYRVPDKVSVLLLLYFAVSPKIVTQLVNPTKDVLYTGVLIFLVLCLFRMLTGREKKRTLLQLLLLTIPATLLRNEGVYVLVLIFLVLFIGKKAVRKRLFGAALLAAGVFLLWNAVILPAFHVTPGSVREAIGIPLQQTARYIVEYGDEVTDEEKEAIEGILPYDEIADAYDSTTSDPIKALFKEESGTEELIAYFKVWVKMFFKHPGVYVEAALAKTIRYFYPTETTHDTYSRSLIMWYYLNQALSDGGVDVTFGAPAALQTLGLKLDEALTTLNYLPGFEVLQSSALYVWLVLLMVCYACKTKKSIWFLSAVPAGVVILVCITCPIDGWYFRYVFPFASFLPPVAAMLVFGRPQEQLADSADAPLDADMGAGLHELPDDAPDVTSVSAGV